MKEFVLLIKGNEMHLISDDERNRRMQEYAQWMQQMVQEDRYVTGQSLESKGHLVKDKDTVLTDGPFLEPKEVIGGFVSIKATDIDEATEITKNCPLLKYYQIFVRPLQAHMDAPK